MKLFCENVFDGDRCTNPVSPEARGHCGRRTCMTREGVVFENPQYEPPPAIHGRRLGNIPGEHREVNEIARRTLRRALSSDSDTFDERFDKIRLNHQLFDVFRFMADGEWHTLAEISEALDVPTQSVSARLRDLRMERFGEWNIDRQRDPEGSGSRVHEYRLLDAVKEGVLD